MALSSAASIFRRVGPGQLYLAPAPTADPGLTPGVAASTADGYYGLFYGATAILQSTKRVLLTTAKPYANVDNTGIDLKVKASKVKFDPNNGPSSEMVTGIDTAEVDFTFFDVDPAHLVDIFGSQAADLITIAAATGVAGRNIAILGPQSYNTLYTAMYRVPSSTIPGEFFHYLFPCVSLIADLDVKMSKKDDMKIKLTLQLMCSPFLLNSAGFGAVIVSDDPTAPHL